MTFRAEVATLNQLAEALSLKSFERVYAPMEFLNEDTRDKARIIAVPPVFLGGDEQGIAERLRELRDMGFGGALAHTLGHIELIKSTGLNPHGGFRLNITNSLAQRKYEELGLVDGVFSVELAAKGMTLIERGIPMGFMACGHLPFMVMRHDPGNNLTDRLGNRIEILRRFNEAEILNPIPLVAGDVAADFAVLRYSEDEVVRMEPQYEQYTRGLYGKDKSKKAK
jgi:hypothetical protein